MNLDFVAALIGLTTEGWVALGIMGLLAASLIAAIVGANSAMTKDRKALKQLKDLLKDYDPDEDGALEPEDLEDSLPKGMVRDAALAVQRGVRFPQGMSSALAAALRPRYLPNSTRLYPNLFMLLGLLGTVWGLAGTLGTLAPQVQQAAQATSPDQLARDLGATIGAMQGAFGASLWGIILAALSSWVLGRVGLSASKLAAQVEEVALSELAVAVLPPSIEESLESQLRALKSSGQVVKDFQSSFSETLNRFEKDVSAASDSLGKNVAQLMEVSQGISEQLQVSLKNLSEAGMRLADTGDRLASGQEALTDRFAGATLAVSTELAARVTELVNLEQRFDEGTKDILRGIGFVVERIDGNMKDYHLQSTEHLRAVEKVAEAIGRGLVPQVLAQELAEAIGQGVIQRAVAEGVADAIRQGAPEAPAAVPANGFGRGSASEAVADGVNQGNAIHPNAAEVGDEAPPVSDKEVGRE